MIEVVGEGRMTRSKSKERENMEVKDVEDRDEDEKVGVYWIKVKEMNVLMKNYIWSFFKVI